MKSSFKKIICSLLSLAFVFTTLITNVYANNGLSISSSASSVKEGSTFTVTVKASSNVFISDLSLSVSGGTVTSGLNKTSIDKGETATATIKLSSDSCTVSVTGISANYDNETEAAASASVTVKKKVETTNNTPNNNSGTTNNNTVSNKSSDNTLKSLTISNGTLSPSFKANKTSYNISLAGTATEVTINASVNHSKATVSGTGTKTLKVGENTFNVVCKAENGSKKTYTLVFHVDETPLVYTKYNEMDLGVVRALEGLTPPTDFKLGTISLEGKDVTGFVNDKTGMTIAYLVNENGDKDYYIIKDGAVISKFKKVNINGKEYMIVNPPLELEEINELTSNKIKIGEIELDGWTFSDEKHANYSVIYLMNSDGKESLYSYESTEGTLQLYSPFELEEVKNEKLDLDIFMITTGVFAFTTLASLIYIVYYKKKKVSEIKEYYERRSQKQGE